MFIEDALMNCDCCLIHSYDGTNRCAACLAMYFMVRYNWNAQDSLKYIKLIRPITICNNNFIQQLQMFESRVSFLRGNIPKSELPDDSFLLLNTFNNIINTKQGKLMNRKSIFILYLEIVHKARTVYIFLILEN